MKFLFKSEAIVCHLLCPAMIFIFSYELITGESRYTSKELWMALIFFLIAYPLALLLIWLKSFLENREQKEAVRNPKSPADIRRHRRSWRWFSLIWIHLAGIIFVIMGHRDWEIDMLPAHYVGYGLLAFGLAGILGLNIWYKGPIDPQNDPVDEADIES